MLVDECRKQEPCLFRSTIIEHGQQISAQEFERTVSAYVCSFPTGLRIHESRRGLVVEDCTREVIYII